MINILLMLTLTSAAYAGAPQLITYQGTLRKAGAIYTGTVPMEFKVTNADGSVTWWTSGSTGVYVSGGLFRYPLGTPNEAQFAVIPWGTVSPYVRVIVDGAALPADPLQSAPYAMHAGTAEGSAGNFNLADGDLRISTTAGSRGIIFQDGSAQYTASSAGLWAASGVDIYNSNAGNVGIGTAGPSQKLEVAGTAKATAFQGDGAALTNITASNIAGGSFANSAYTFPNSLTISGSLGADLNVGGFKITNLAEPAAAQDVATKNYVDVLTGGGLPSAVLSATQTFTGLNGFSNQLTISSNLFVTGGRIGIGTSSPAQELEVVGTAKATAFQGEGAALTNITASNIAGGSFANSAYTFPNNVTISGSLGAALNAGGFKITNLAEPAAAQDGATKNYVDGLTGGGLPSAVLSATQTFTGQNSFSDRVTVSSNLFVTNGSVGIGTISPTDFKLQVAGNIGPDVDNTYDLGTYGGKHWRNINLKGILTLESGARAMLKATDGSYSFIDNVAGGEIRIKTDNDATTLLQSLNGNVGIGTTGPGAKLDVAGGVKVANDAGACDASKAGTIRWTGSSFQGCTGAAWFNLAAVPDGTSALTAGRTCKKLRDDGVATVSGVYWLDPTGVGPAFQAYCDMTTDGGGWTLVMRMANDATFGYTATTYWTSGTLLNSTSLDPTTNTNALYQSYSTVSGTEIRGCRDAGTLCIISAVSVTNAKALFSGSTQVLSTGLRATFIATMPPDDASQPNCNQSGINVGGASGFARFGLVGNNEGDCNTDDSAWGWGVIGSGSHLCGAGNATWNSGGNLYTCRQGTLWVR